MPKLTAGVADQLEVAEAALDWLFNDAEGSFQRSLSTAITDNDDGKLLGMLYYIRGLRNRVDEDDD